MLVKNRSLVVIAALAVGLLAGGCATVAPVDPQLALAPGQTMTPQEATQLSSEAERQAYEGRLPQASALYMRVVTAYPNNAQAWFRLGTVYLRGGQYTYAQRAFQHTLRADPRMTKAQANLALVHLYQFRVAATEAIRSTQVSEANRAALASLLRDVDHAFAPAAVNPVPAR